MRLYVTTRLSAAPCRSAAMAESLQEGKGKVATAAKRLYLHFLDALFKTPVEDENKKGDPEK